MTSWYILGLLGRRRRYFAHHRASLRLCLHHIVSAVASRHEATVVQGVMLLSHGSLDIIRKRVGLHHLLDTCIVLRLLLLTVLSLTIVRSWVKMNLRLFELLRASSDLVENVCVQVGCRRH